MQQPFRFIHSSDFHLDRPLGGLAEIPDQLRSICIEAPYRAAQRVFDAAIKERVDFVVLVGDLVDPLMSGPRGLAFLGDQFARLAEKNIHVYWAGGRSDDFERWADAWPNGDNVVRFALDRVERIVHLREGRPLLQILGTSGRQKKRIRASEFRPDASSLFTLAVAYGSADAELFDQHPVSFWALGSEHNRRSLVRGPTTAQYCGSPQGRRPSESGPHGCTLVHVDEHGQARTSAISTEAVRYVHEQVSITDATSVDALCDIMRQRANELLSDPFGPELLVDWAIPFHKPLAAALAGGVSILLARLRADQADRRPAAWPISVQMDSPPPAARERMDEDSVLGEFLRTVRHYSEHADAPLNLEPFLSERHLAGRIGAAAAIDSPATRHRVLDEVARLGLELLSPEERAS